MNKKQNLIKKKKSNNEKGKETKENLLKPKIDVVFHSLFREGNEGITKALISSVIKEKINDIKLDNDRYVFGKYPEEKLGILDLKATLGDGKICDVEIQLVDNKDTEARFLYYWSRIYSSQLTKGNIYKDLNKVIGIIILDFPLEKTKALENICTEWKITEVTTGLNLVLTEMLQIYIIEISKAKRTLEKEPNNELAQWVLFLDNPNQEEVFKAMETNKELKEAMKNLDEISQQEELRRVAELREKAIMDEKNALTHALEDGKKEGLKKGMEIGRAEGKAEGQILGKKETQKEIARKMLEKNFSIEEIQSLIPLSQAEIEELKATI